MANSYGNFATLSDASGIVCDSSAHQITGVALRSALTGSLTVTGVANVSGSPAAWVIAPASTGWQTPAGDSLGLAGRVSFSLSNPGADAGKAQLLFTPK